MKKRKVNNLKFKGNIINLSYTMRSISFIYQSEKSRSGKYES